MRRKKQKPAGMSEAAFLDTLMGPYCKSCGLVRTKNPSKECLKCLGVRACFGCRGHGEVRRWAGRVRVVGACASCGGTGMVGRASLAGTASRVFSREGWWHAELDHEGKTYFIGRFSTEERADGAIERWRRAVLGTEEKSSRRLTAGRELASTASHSLGSKTEE